MATTTGMPGQDRYPGTALVTGAAQGIGDAIARRLYREGARLAVNDIVASSILDGLATDTGGIAVPADISDPAQINAMIASLQTDGHHVGTLVCNAAYMSMHPFLDHPPDDWWKVITTNLTGTYHLIHAVLPGMQRHGSGRIVIISSYWGMTGWPGATAYAASKAGLISLTKSLGRELAPSGVIVNAIAPGVIATEQLRVDAAAASVDASTIQDRYAQAIPIGRIGQPDEIASAAAFLARHDIGAMIGQTLQINGGEVRARA